ncbi:MAG: type II toxin-antitoxin system RelB/DinJ family antitoxin [Selenomonadaceae bacterium]|nr:type II toxin-antitoxin system RelB/DinJ family antitoxin [Selenomonadaceae bacterium]
MAMLSVRLDGDDKSRFENFCSQVGLNVSTCINMFVQAVLR